jgi:hypothetical protein
VTRYNTISEIEISVQLVIDQTAVGARIADMIVTGAGRSARRVILSGTHTEDYSDGLYRIPKQSLVGGLEVLLETKRLKIARGLTEARHLTDELVNYRNRKTSNLAFTADTWREQPSDDLVFAVALSCWQLERPQFWYQFL